MLAAACLLRACDASHAMHCLPAACTKTPGAPSSPLLYVNSRRTAAGALYVRFVCLDGALGCTHAAVQPCLHSTQKHSTQKHSTQKHSTQKHSTQHAGGGRTSTGLHACWYR
jgi:hypothetical protein